jgi:MoCo/4Fe-4S cofactor protein with predicted Tat translocation signal
MSEIHDHDHDHDMEMKKALRPQVERDNTHWLSLEQWKNDPEFMQLAETEFTSSPLREGETESGWARREFLKLMGASLAMATASCIRRPVQKIVPYNKQPEEVTLGVANYYSSAYFDGADGLGMLVKTREGRPIKIEANPLHPFSQSGLNIRSQATIWSLYDPERLQGPKRNLFNDKKGNAQVIDVKWEDLDKKVVEQLKKGDVVLLTGAVSSPATRALIGDFSQGFKAKHVVWEPIAHEEIRDGQKASYGEEVVPLYRFDKAKMIVSIDADFLGTWIAPTAFTNQFVNGRKDIKNMSRMVSFDSTYSLTASNADIRMRIKPSQQLDVVMGLLHEIIVKKGAKSYASNNVEAALNPYADAAKRLGVDPAVFSQVAADLLANKGQSLVVAGGLQTMTERSRDLQVAVNMLNSVLENDGKTVDHAGDYSHEELDLIGVRASLTLQHKFISTPMIPWTSEISASVFNANLVSSFPEVLLSVGNDVIDISDKYREAVLCVGITVPIPILPIPDIELLNKKPVASILHNVHWAKLKEKNDQLYVTITGAVSNNCVYKSNIWIRNNDSKLNISFRIRKEDGNWKISRSSIQVDQYKDPWWKIIRLPNLLPGSW